MRVDRIVVFYRPESVGVEGVAADDARINLVREAFPEAQVTLTAADQSSPEAAYAEQFELRRRLEAAERDAEYVRGQLHRIQSRMAYQLAVETLRWLRTPRLRRRVWKLPRRLWFIARTMRRRRILRGEAALALLRQPPRAIVAEIDAHEPHSKRAAERMLGAGQTLAYHRRFAEAAELFAAAVQRRPSADAYRELYETLQAQQKLQDAYEAFCAMMDARAARRVRIDDVQVQRMQAGPAYQLALRELVPARLAAASVARGRRLAYVLHNSLPYSSGGYATRTHGLALGLTRSGYDVTAFTRAGYPLDVNPHLDADAAAQTDEIDGICYVRILEPSRRALPSYKFVPAAANALEQHLRAQKTDIVIAASNYMCALPALIAARRLGLPFIYEVRGFWEITRLSREPGYIHNPWYTIQEHMEAFVCNQADRVVTLTAAMREELIRRGVDGQKIAIVPNACNPEKFEPRPRDLALAQRLGIPEDVPVIGYVGTFVDYEGLDDLARACGFLKRRGLEFRLLLVGNENVSSNDRGTITDRIVEIAATFGFSDWLIMPGRVPHDEVAAYYSLIDVAPFPRKPWPVCEMVSPMKPLEAMAMKKTVVVSSVAALDEMVGHGKYGLVFAKGEPAALTEVLARALGDAELRSRLGAAGREYVLAARTWMHSAQALAAELARFEEAPPVANHAG